MQMSHIQRTILPEAGALPIQPVRKAVVASCSFDTKAAAAAAAPAARPAALRLRNKAPRALGVRPLLRPKLSSCSAASQLEPQSADTGDSTDLVAVAHAQLQQWVQRGGADDSAALPFPEVEVRPLPRSSGRVAAAATAFLSGSTRTAVVCVAVQDQSSSSGKSSGSKDGALDGAVVHWACQRRPQGSWHPPPPGWRTDPDWSADAGHGAWQTALRPIEGTPGLYSALIEIPLEGPLKNSGARIPFAVKTASGKWLKDGDTREDFFAPVGVLLDAGVPSAPGPATDAGGAEKGNKEESKGEGEGKREKEGDKGREDRGNSQERRMLELFGVRVALGLPNGPSTAATLRLRRGSRSSDPDPAVAVPARPSGGLRPPGVSVAPWAVDFAADNESQAERSLMHRFQIANTLLSRVVDEEGRGGAEAGLLVLVAWLRFSAARHLTWNRNYNIKPREISAAQDTLTKRCAEETAARPHLWELLRIAMASVGRGGEGNAGQRIRDEILTVQSSNGAKGGMMEEWHQKLHNNTSPDDVVICEALLAYLRSGLDISQYWETLHASGIDKQRLLSYDRAIRNEPSFSKGQIPGLTRDLENYLHTLKAVHCGDDLKSAAASVLGYTQERNKGKGVTVHPVPGVATEALRDALVFLLEQQQQQGAGSSAPAASLTDRLGAAAEARCLLAPAVSGSAPLEDPSRLRDVIFLDLALESATRTYVEAEVDRLNKAQSWEELSELWVASQLMLEGCCLSLGSNEELLLCLKEFSELSLALGWGLDGSSPQAADATSTMRLQAAVQRLQGLLGDRAQAAVGSLQPSAEGLGQRLGIDSGAVSLFAEEVIRSGPIAPMSQLVAALGSCLRRITDQGPWQVVAPVGSAVTGQVEVAQHLADVQHLRYDRPTVVVALSMGGEEEVPEGAVAVITPSSTDVLCHAAIRARNNRVLLVTCHDPAEVERITASEGSWVTLSAPLGGDVSITFDVPEPTSDGSASKHSDSSSSSSSASASGDLVEEKEWSGEWAMPSGDFTGERVGAKALNVEAIRGMLPDWVQLPVSVAIPYGAFEATVERDPNGVCAKRVRNIREAIKQGDISILAGMRVAVQHLPVNNDILEALEQRLGEAGFELRQEDRESAWRCITAVWSSQWNDRVVLALRKAAMPHDLLSMSVLCQPLLPARYAFVAHTTNPLTGDASEAYVEVVRGLGEVLVGNYAGSALRATVSKLPNGGGDLSKLTPGDLSGAVDVLGLPSKSVALHVPSTGSFMFRSDSNCEDLDGFAGAGFFDSVPMDTPETVYVDYTAEPLVQDAAFREETLSRIAAASVAVEIALGGVPQDVEGVILEDGTLYVVQSRPQVF